MTRDVVLRGGRVVDPGAGTDGVADLLIRDGRIAAVGPGLAVPPDAVTVDVAGSVVGPGFIDIHSHVHTISGQRLQAMDGVTTTLDLESGLMPVAVAYRRAAAEGRPLNFGFSASWSGARGEVLLGAKQDASFEDGMALLGRADWQRSSSPAELTAWLRLLDRELADGALGIGVLLGYAPHSDPGEFLQVAQLAAGAGAPVYTHVRDLVELAPDIPIDGSEEIAVAAAETGAAMHHCHVNSTSGRHIDRVLGLLDRARTDGARVSVECYPYGAGSTAIGASFLAPELLSRRGLTPSRLVLVSTGERIADEARLREVRATSPGEPCVFEFFDESDPGDLDLLRRSLAFPDAIVASDAIPVFWPDGSRDSLQWPLPPGGLTHPRTAGTFTRSLRLMVRESGAWSWLEAFRRCSALPARVLADIAPAVRRKGHVGVGADADVVVLDPETVTDQATYLDPTRPARGVRHLLVGGEFVVRDGELDPTAMPGRPLRGSAR